MSKMSELHRELSEQAYDLGFLSLEDAENHGWRVNYETAKLEPPVVQPSLDELAELEKAHFEWVEEKKAILHDLMDLREAMNREKMTEWAAIISNTIKFVRKGEV